MPRIKQTTVRLSIVVSNLTITAHTQVKAQSGSKLSKWQLSWGDGTQSAGFGAPPLNLTHTYPAQTQNYTIHVQVWDSRNGTAEDSAMGAIIHTPPASGGGGQVGLISGLMLDDFEENPLRTSSDLGIFRHANFDPPFADTGDVADDQSSAAAPYQGSRHYRSNCSVSGADYAHYPNFIKYINGGSGIANLRDSRTSVEAWTYDYYNRLRFWVRPPTTHVQPGVDTGGEQTFNIGMYWRTVENDNTSNQELGGWHGYNFYRMTGTGTYWQLLFSPHFTAVRNGIDPPGSAESWNPNTDLWDDINWGLYGLDYPTNEAGQNFMDRWSTFYLALFRWPTTNPTGNMDVDAIEFYREPNDVAGNRIANIINVYAMAANYRASDNLLSLSWNRWKSDDTTSHEVRYAFSDIYTLGWNNATALQTIAPRGSGGANVMWLEDDTIDMGANDYIYIAIKPQGDSTFNQIIHPVTGPATV